MKTAAVLILLALGFIWTQVASAATNIPLTSTNWRAISFEQMPANTFTFDSDGVSIAIDKSSSFLVHAFKERQPVKKVNFEWRSVGELKVRDAQHQKEKSGDDARLRVGLILSGKPRLLPFFAPTWIKMLGDTLKHPPGTLLNLIVGSPEATGREWTSPYSESIIYRACDSKPLADGWQTTTAQFPAGKDLVGIWLFADGDDTKSTFQTRIRLLRLE